MFDRIELSAASIKRDSFENLKIPSKFCKSLLLYVVRTFVTIVSIDVAVFVVDLESNFTVLVSLSFVIYGSTIVGRTDAILYPSSNFTILSFCACVKFTPDCVLIARYTCPYLGGLLSSPPHT